MTKWQINYIDIPTFETDNLMIRPIEKSDAQAFFNLRSDENVNKYLDRTAPESIEEIEQFIDKLNGFIKSNESFFRAITLKDDHNLIGTICLWNFNEDKSKAEIGFESFPEFQGKGLINEAVIRILDFGFNDLNLKQISGWTVEGNNRSRNLLEKNGFKRDLQAELKVKENEAETVIYTLDKPGIHDR